MIRLALFGVEQMLRIHFLQHGIKLSALNALKSLYDFLPSSVSDSKHRHQ